MADPKTCPKCGAELPSNAPAGICPTCLLQAGLAGEQDAGSSPEMNPTALASGFVPPEPRELSRHFPQLEILELLGKGGMGAVYKARQPGLDRLVAVKILPPEIGADPAFAERFTREARALAKLSHQNIVSVFDFGQADGQFFFIMEFVDGTNLRHVIETGEIRPAEALAIVPQICEALQFAHDEGIVHRDIKPENILVDKHGRVKIADFGLAKLLSKAPAEFTLTGTHQVMGTMHYMAPEQMQGAGSVDHRADIYSLGVVFYEILTGQLPIGRFEPPSRKIQVDVRLDDIVLRALENEPHRRYQHAGDLKTDVDSISNDTGTSIREYAETPVGPTSRERLTISTLWHRLTWLPARLTWEAILLFFLGWIITGAAWNYGRWGLLAGGCAMTVLGCLVAVRCRRVLPRVRQQPATGPWSRVSVHANVVVGFLFAWCLLVAAAVSSWTLFVDLTMLNEDPAVYVEQHQGQEHRLIRQLSEFENEIPDVEFTKIGLNYTSALGATARWVWIGCFAIGGMSCVASALWGVLDWRPCFGMAALMAMTLLLTHVGAHLVSQFQGGAIHANMNRTARAPAKLDTVMITIDQWLEDQEFGKRFSNSWQLESVPDGQTVARVRRLGCAQNWSDRWSVGWAGPIQRSPALEIVCLSSVTNEETVVQVSSNMGRRDQGTISAWEPLIDSLREAVESTESD